MTMESELRHANALLAANRRLQSATAALLSAKSLDELDRKIIDVLPGAIGFERVALLSPPTNDAASQVLHELGYPGLDLTNLPKNSPFGRAAYVDGQRTGSEDDDDLPHAGVRGAYVIAPLRDRDRIVALLYADSLREEIVPADAAAAVAYALEIAGMVRANLSLAAELRALARTDALTGLPNRRVFDERLDQELQRSARSRRPFALVILDLDRFKNINDTYGHHGGDEALRSFAHAIRDHARHADFVARFAGDEFAMLLVDVDRSAAHAILARLLQSVRELSLSIPVQLSASAGVALSFPVDTCVTILERADAALYDAKQAGRDCARFS
jgi:diguanylate cyclase (GGDEF)-like protein